LDLESFLDDRYAPERQAFLQPMLERALAGQMPVLLPLVNPQKKVGFYLAGADSRAMAELQSMCRAFLGTADADGDYRIRRVGQNPSEAALLEQMPHGFIRVVVRNGTDREAIQRVREALLRLVGLLEERPPLHRQERRPTGRILRDFLTACQQGQSIQAQAFIRELKLRESLGSLNLVMLEIRALAAGNRWAEILQYPGLEFLVRGPLPSSLVAPLLQALSHALPGRPLEEVSIQDVKAFCQPLASLFLAPPELDPSLEGVWRTWATGAAALHVSGCIDRLPASMDPAWIGQLQSWAGLDQPASPLPLVLVSAPRAGLPERMLFAERSDYQALVTEFDGLPETERQQMLVVPRLAGLVETLRRELRASRMDWNQWFRDMSRATREEVQFLGQVALLESDGWPREAFDEEEIQRCLSGTWEPPAQVALRNAIPALLGWLQSRGLAGSADLWRSLLMILALDDLHSESDLVLAGQVADAFLAMPHQASAYRDVLDAVGALWDKAASVESARRCLDLVELFSLHVVADRPAMEGFAQVAFQYCRIHRERMSPVALSLASDLARDLFGATASVGLEPALALPNEERGLDLQGKTLAIYTLTEPAGRRAKDFLEKQYPGLVVRLNADHQATEALQHLAETADYFVFSTRSSKHQAYYPVVEQFRRRGMELLYPEGKGTSSLIEAFERSVRG
jgi:hypothetical protein